MWERAPYVSLGTGLPVSRTTEVSSATISAGVPEDFENFARTWLGFAKACGAGATAQPVPCMGEKPAQAGRINRIHQDSRLATVQKRARELPLPVAQQKWG